MKAQVQKDRNLFIALFVVTIIFFIFSSYFYNADPQVDDILDFFGLSSILLGVYLRMAGRGYKKVNSQGGKVFLTKGPYLLVRNPMYLGSFLIGAGFVLLIWPWWTVIVFLGVFYVRFNKRIRNEEEFLKKKYGEEHEKFCQTTSCLFPRLCTITQLHWGEVFPLKETWLTSEKYALGGLPLIAFVFELIQETFVYNYVNFRGTCEVFLFTIFIFIIMMTVLCKK